MGSRAKGVRCFKPLWILNHNNSITSRSFCPSFGLQKHSRLFHLFLQALGHYVSLNTRHLPRLVPPISPGTSVPSHPPLSELGPTDLVSPLFISWVYS